MNRENCRPVDDPLLDWRRCAADVAHKLGARCRDQLGFFRATVELQEPMRPAMRPYCANFHAPTIAQIRPHRAFNLCVGTDVAGWPRTNAHQFLR